MKLAHLFQDVVGYFLKIPVREREVLKVTKTFDCVTKSENHMYFSFFIHIFMQSFKANKDFPCSIKFLHGSLKIVSEKI